MSRISRFGRRDCPCRTKPVCDRAGAVRLLPWFRSLRQRGADVLVGDPGRAYRPPDALAELAVYEVPVTRALEDSEIKKTTVWRFDETAG